MNVRVQLFAVARQKCGASAVEVSVPEVATVGDLRAALAAQCPELAAIIPASRLAVDSQYAVDSLLIPPSAEVALIPPVSGG
jgi:molybdopterin converting factor subunit 1